MVKKKKLSGQEQWSGEVGKDSGISVNRVVICGPTQGEMMLLFKPEHVDPILKGLKTQTRRLNARCKIGSIHLAKTKMLSPECFAHLLINNKYKQPLGDMSEEDAIKEGYSSVEEYIQVWNRINPNHPWAESREVDVVEFTCLETRTVG